MTKPRTRKKSKVIDVEVDRSLHPHLKLLAMRLIKMGVCSPYKAEKTALELIVHDSLERGILNDNDLITGILRKWDLSR